jgi:hypothetical protein
MKTLLESMWQLLGVYHVEVLWQLHTTKKIIWKHLNLYYSHWFEIQKTTIFYLCTIVRLILMTIDPRYYSQLSSSYHPLPLPFFISFPFHQWRLSLINLFYCEPLRCTMTFKTKCFVSWLLPCTSNELKFNFFFNRKHFFPKLQALN